MTLSNEQIFAAMDILKGIQHPMTKIKDLKNVHNPSLCSGRNCVIHNPSDNHMKDWPLNWRDDRKIMERICEHGVGHPDRDELTYQDSRGNFSVGIHGCDGCCRA